MSPPAAWIPETIFGFIACIISFYIVLIEIKQRQKANSTKSSTTKSLEITSLLSIIFGAISLFFLSVNELNIFCYFSSFCLHLFFSSQFVCLGFYQLSRLHYCFSNDKIHLNKGYPKWLFIIMFIFGLTFHLIWNTVLIFYGLYSKCGIDDDLNTYGSYVKSEFAYTKVGATMYIIVGIFSPCWDIVTLLLYLYKICALTKNKKKKGNIKSILFILYRICILTIFYQVIFISLGLIFVALENVLPPLPHTSNTNYFGSIMQAFLSLVWTISVYLMMEHNTTQYIKFLKIVNRFKLHWICCCCCKFIVIEQLKDLQGSYKMEKSQKDTTTETKDLHCGQVDGVQQNSNVDTKVTMDGSGGTDIEIMTGTISDSQISITPIMNDEMDTF